MRWTMAALAAAVAFSAVPATAGDTTTADAATRATHGREWLATRAKLAERVPFALNDDAAEVWGDWHQLVDAGDLDGDGKSDVVDLRSHLEYDDYLGFVETVRLDAYRGTDGKALWTRTLPPASFVFPFVGAVGLDGKPGVIVISYTDVGGEAVVAGAGQFGTAVSTFDRTGAPVIVRSMNGAWAGAPVSYADGWTDVLGTFDAVAGGGVDFLLQSTVVGAASDVTGAVDQARVVVQYEVMDGATGAVRPVGQPIASEGSVPYGTPAGDLDGDKLHDFVVETEAGDAVDLGAYSGADGDALWALPKYSPSGPYGEAAVYDLADVTGDGVSDLGVASFAYSMHVPGRPSPASGAQVALVDGKRGKVVWRKAGDELFVLGNVDRKPGNEVAVGSSIHSTRLGFSVSAYTASGRRLWTRTRTLPMSKSKEYLANNWGPIGDANSDGVEEVGFSIVNGFDRKAKRDEGTIDGRTGRAWRDPRPNMRGTRAAFDGRGADAFEMTSGNVLSITAWRGDAPVKLWASGVRVAGSYIRSFPTSVDGDKCGDLGATVVDDRDVFRSVIFSGSTGKALWVLERSGTAAGTVKAPAVASHRTFRKGC